METTGYQFKFRMTTRIVDNLDLEDIDFRIEAFAKDCEKRHIIRKEDCEKLDPNNYAFVVDTSKTGPGMVNLEIHFFLPDFNGVREVVKTVNTKESTKSNHKQYGRY